MKATVTDKHIECARVYVDRNNRTTFRLKCFYCCSVFLHWTRFAQHIETRHRDLDKAYLRAESLWTEGEAVSAGTEGQTSTGSADTVLLKTEMVLISEEALDLVEEATEIRKDCDGSKVEFLPENATIEVCEAEPDFDSRNDEAVDLNMKRKRRKRISSPEVSTTEAETVNKIDGMECLHNTRNPLRKKKLLNKRAASLASATVTGTENKQTLLNSGRESQQSVQGEGKVPRRKRSTWTGRIFYNLRDTNPEILLDFIEMIRRDPCQWDPHDPDYRDKDKRDESSEQICMALQERWNITSSPQVVRTSVLSLCRWFVTEHMRKQREGSNFKCFHPDYYAKLYAFLPHEDIKSFPCDQCTRKYKSEALLLSHKYAAHNGEMPYKCHYCSRSFLHLSSFRHHENRHTKERVWPCDLCDYRSPTKTDYTLHKITHTDIRAYVCHLCGASYKSSTSLNVHKRLHEPPQLKCDECGQQFHENYRLKRHMLLKHDGAIATTQRTHQCSTCQAKFTRKANLQRHLLKHSIGGEVGPMKVEINTDEEDAMTDLVEQLNIPEVEGYIKQNKEAKGCIKQKQEAEEEEEELEDNDVASLQSDEEEDDALALAEYEEQSSSGEEERCRMKVFSCVPCHQQFMDLQALRAHSLKAHNVMM